MAQCNWCFGTGTVTCTACAGKGSEWHPGRGRPVWERERGWLNDAAVPGVDPPVAHSHIGDGLKIGPNDPDPESTAKARAAVVAIVVAVVCVLVLLLLILYGVTYGTGS